MKHFPPEVQRALKTAIESIEWCNFGPVRSSFHYRYKNHKDDGSWELTIYPALHEVVWGKNDGAEVYPNYCCSLMRLTELFDTVIDIGIDTKVGQTHIDGIIGEVLIMLVFMHRPHPRATINKKLNGYTNRVMSG